MARKNARKSVKKKLSLYRLPCIEIRYAVAGLVIVFLVAYYLLYELPPYIPPPPTEPVFVQECASDTDCTPAGCSSQICTTSAKAPSVITTCEMREEYACLRQTSCSCIEGRCAWSDTPEYRECI
ncbi:MAG: eight-cysteine-cluster domain-containing protein, partial [Candidatus Aenigmarchaeota archaeon]|nr:eight-cysteine-cluster domain-containing protein [Candidatus Aenigmarchaeota archaeon]MDI6722344.1 eight-cysteine-cluster domain-containing protein [Candidatus Aenigmarchaeota archaeon]